MTLLDELKGLLGIEDEEALPASEEIAARRSEVREEIERLESELKALRSDDGRRRALQEADSPEEVGRRRRLLRDRIEGLEELDDQLVERQRAAKNREMRAGLREAVENLPELADEFEKARAAERKARSELEEALSEVGDATATLEHRGLAPDLALPEAQIDRLERLAEHVGGHHSGALDALRPDVEEGESERRVIEDVQHRVRYLVGDWSEVDDWRNRVPPAPTGWTTDVSRAEGIAAD